MSKIKSAMAIVVLAVISSMQMQAMNPYLPLWEYIPDGEPYVFEDPDNPGMYRVYIYGSHDSLIDAYCGREQVVWSAPVENLADWRYDGIILEVKKDAEGKLLNEGGVGDVLFAPDVALVVNADGTKTYYLYPNDQHGGRNGLIAKSNRPDGPFEPCNWNAENPRVADGILRFDPAVFVDDDGRVYGYWGFEESWGAELDPNTMATIKPGAEAKNLIPGHKQDETFRFFEASSMRKIKDKYVLIYSRWSADGDFGLGESNYTLAYAYSDNPLGPWKYGGTLIDGRGRETLPDGTTICTATPNGNTHGSICEINGQWYVFYHRQAGTDEFSRQAMVAPIEVKVTEGPNGKVEISEGEYTSEGFNINGLPFSGVYPAGIACHYTGPTPAESIYPKKIYSGSYVKATRYDGNPRTAPSDIELKSNPVVNNTNGSVVGYKYFNFDSLNGTSEKEMTVNIKPNGVDGTVTVMVGKWSEPLGGKKVGDFSVSKDSPQIDTDVKVKLSGLDAFTGKQPLYFLFSSPTQGVSICDFNSFSF